MTDVSKTTEANPNHHTWDAVNRHCLLCGIPMMDSELDAECPEQGGVQKENTSGQTTGPDLDLPDLPYGFRVVQVSPHKWVSICLLDDNDHCAAWPSKEAAQSAAWRSVSTAPTTEVLRLRAALAYYAAPDHWEYGEVPGHVYAHDDAGSLARKTLGLSQRIPVGERLEIELECRRIMSEENPAPLFVACEFCQTEGRIYTQRGNHPDDVTDHGTCPECHGECVVAVETQPVTLEDMQNV